MKKLSIFLITALVILGSCTKSKEVHPELGDGNEEFLTVGATTVHVEYTRTDLAELQKVVFHYNLSGVQQFTSIEMTKRESFFELTLNDLLSDTLYHYYYELFPSNGEASITEQKNFHTLAVDTPLPLTPPVVELPTVVTAKVSEITANSAVCGGEVTNDGGAEVTEPGICWSINANPTIDDNHVAAGSGVGAFTATISGLEANTTYHVRAYATNEAGTAYGLDREFTTLSGGGGEHEYVDLGLPSGTLWATSDIDYVAWGETGGNGGFDVSSYSYCFGGYNMLTKYCNNPNYGYNGFVDNLTVLEPMDDAATVLWGDDWHTPTKEQWQELIDNTINNWTLQDGAYGWIFTANNGRSLFFEAAGMAIDGGFGYIGSEGCYWSSSLYTNDPSLAWCLDFSSGGCYVGGQWRAQGLLVRPVRSSTK